MALYFLYTRTQGNSNWTYSGYQLNVAGNSNSPGANGLLVQARTYNKSNPGQPGQWQAVSNASRTGNGTPNNPQNGDDLGLPSTMGPLTDLEGDGTYDSTGVTGMGAGYYTTQGSPKQDEGDWCATSN